MRKKVFGVALAAVVLLAVVGILLWRAMEGPFYRPGMVRSGENLRGSLEPPKQTGDGSFWQVACYHKWCP